MMLFFRYSCIKNTTRNVNFSVFEQHSGHSSFPFQQPIRRRICFILSIRGVIHIITISIYHRSEQYFSRALIGQLGGDQLSTIYLRAAEEKQNDFCRYCHKRSYFWSSSHSACVVYTKTMIHLSVGESGGYLPRRFAIRQISTTIHLHFGE